MSEMLPNLEGVQSRRAAIQDEIKDIYHEMAGMEFDSSDLTSDVDDRLDFYMSRISELEAELALL